MYRPRPYDCQGCISCSRWLSQCRSTDLGDGLLCLAYRCKLAEGKETVYHKIKRMGQLMKEGGPCKS